jgi:hypothetical protein
MNFLEAVKTGKGIRRLGWDYYLTPGTNLDRPCYLNRAGIPCAIFSDDVLADDWQIEVPHADLCVEFVKELRSHWLIYGWEKINYIEDSYRRIFGHPPKTMWTHNADGTLKPENDR